MQGGLIETLYLSWSYFSLSFELIKKSAKERMAFCTDQVKQSGLVKAAASKVKMHEEAWHILIITTARFSIQRQILGTGLLEDLWKRTDWEKQVKVHHTLSEKRGWKEGRAMRPLVEEKGVEWKKIPVGHCDAAAAIPVQWRQCRQVPDWGAPHRGARRAEWCSWLKDNPPKEDDRNIVNCLFIVIRPSGKSRGWTSGHCNCFDWEKRGNVSTKWILFGLGPLCVELACSPHACMGSQYRFSSSIVWKIDIFLEL